jgi:hypothetical protein
MDPAPLNYLTAFGTGSLNRIDGGFTAAVRLNSATYISKNLPCWNYAAGGRVELHDYFWILRGYTIDRQRKDKILAVRKWCDMTHFVSPPSVSRHTFWLGPAKAPKPPGKSKPPEIVFICSHRNI